MSYINIEPAEDFRFFFDMQIIELSTIQAGFIFKVIHLFELISVNLRIPEAMNNIYNRMHQHSHKPKKTRSVYFKYFLTSEQCGQLNVIQYNDEN